MLIVEGGDNVGKSTLVKQLLELDPSLRMLHRQRFKPGGEETIGSSYLKALVPPDEDRLVHANSLADRLVASECIYGQLFRGGCRMSEGEHMAIRQALYAYGAIVVHCDPPDESITATWKDRDQLYDNALQIARVYRDPATLRGVFKGMHIWRYNWTAPDAASLRKTIITHHRRRMDEMRAALAWWSSMPYGSGNLLEAKVMIIGESPSPRAVTPFPFAHGPAGNFLAWTIDRAEQRTGVPILPHTYMTNAEKRSSALSDAALLRMEINFVQPTCVVALGREAAQLLTYVLPTTSPTPPHVAELPHPMYWRRFMFKRRSEYVTKFLRAIEPAFPHHRALV
jgi:uracil-DNA glycosylase